MSGSMRDWDEMTDRERDAAVAEHVMGRAGDECPHYTTDPAADYTVLEHVRRTWDPGWHDFCRRLRSDAAQYQPGDYSCAAYHAVYYGQAAGHSKKGA